MGEIATHAPGAISLGIYRDALDDEVAYLLAHSGASVVLAEDEEQVDKLLAIGERAPRLQRIGYADPRGMRKYDDPRLMPLAELVALGRCAPVSCAARPPGLLADHLCRHGRCGARAGYVPLLPRPRRAAAPALRADGTARRLHAAPRGGGGFQQRRRPAQRRDRGEDRPAGRQWAGRDRHPPPHHLLWLFPRGRRGGRAARRVAAHGRCRIFRREGPPRDNRPHQGHRDDSAGRPVQPAIHRERAEVEPLCCRGRDPR
jgi:hypothetical protein